MYWQPDTGARVVLGEIRDEYLRHGGHTSDLGYPVSDEQPTPDGRGRISYFEHGSISWYPETGVDTQVHGSYREGTVPSSNT